MVFVTLTDDEMGLPRAVRLHDIVQVSGCTDGSTIVLLTGNALIHAREDFAGVMAIVGRAFHAIRNT